MGLLDDAIREHLELKRRRGADPTEVEREEAEALGPVRRGDVDLADAPGGEDDHPEGGEPVSDPGEDVARHDADATAYEPSYESPEPEAAVHLDADGPRRDDSLEHHDAPFAEPEAQSASPPHGDPWSQQATREFSSDELSDALRERPGAAPGPSPEARRPASEPDPDVVAADDEADDVLEETPDFLQETPEHDRLWFEQKPPKDFDF